MYSCEDAEIPTFISMLKIAIIALICLQVNINLKTNLINRTLLWT